MRMRAWRVPCSVHLEIPADLVVHDIVRDVECAAHGVENHVELETVVGGRVGEQLNDLRGV